MTIGINPYSNFNAPMKPAGDGCGAHGGGPDLPGAGGYSSPSNAATVNSLQNLLSQVNGIAVANGGPGAPDEFSGVMAGYGYGDVYGATAAPAVAMPIAMERFIQSQAGGLILDKDGAPAGKLPEGSFLDAKSGTVYGPDSKAITLPEGASVDFFDLPDVDSMKSDYAASTAAPELPDAEGGGQLLHPPSTAPGKGYPGMPNHYGMPIDDGNLVGGQWGPGAPGKAWGGGHTMPMPGPGPKGAIDVFGGGAFPTNVAGMYGDGFPMANASPVLGGGLVGGAQGNAMLGGAPTLESSLAALIATLQQLAMALSMGGGVLAGGPGQVFNPGQQHFPGQHHFPGQVGGAGGPGKVGGVDGPGDKPAPEVVDVEVGTEVTEDDTPVKSEDDTAAAAEADGDESTATTTTPPAGGSSDEPAGSSDEPAETDSTVNGGGGGTPTVTVGTDNAGADDADDDDAVNVASGANNA